MQDPGRPRGTPTSHEAKFAGVSLNSPVSSSQRPCVLSGVPIARATISAGRVGKVGWSAGFFLCSGFFRIAAWTVMHVFTHSTALTTDPHMIQAPTPTPHPGNLPRASKPRMPVRLAKLLQLPRISIKVAKSLSKRRSPAHVKRLRAFRSGRQGTTFSGICSRTR